MTTKAIYNKKGQKIQFRKNEYGTKSAYWKITNGISEMITERQYKNGLKKINDQ